MHFRSSYKLAVLLLALTVGAVSSASADQITLTDASGLKYFVNHNVTFATSSSASGAMSEASYTMPVAATTMGGGEMADTLDDAFDGYGTIAVSLTGATGPVSTGSMDYVIYNQNGAATVQCDGREVAFNAQTAGGLQMTRRVYVPADDTFARQLQIFTNTGSAPLTFNVIFSNNLGSDSNTRITGSSSGDTTASSADTWVATFQNYSGVTSSDPRLAHVLQGTGTVRAPAAGVTFTDGDDNPYWHYTLTLAAGETASILTFVTGQPSKAASFAKATELASLSGHALGCLTAADRRLIANFHAACSGAGDAGMACDDGNPCTEHDACTAASTCAGTPKVCTTGAADCTGVCNPMTGACEEMPVTDGTSCNDGDMCNGADTCAAGVCSGHGAALGCDDHDACTADSCVAASGCMNMMMAGCRTCSAAADCDDHNACTGAETCGLSGTCEPGTMLDCDDADPCTADMCVPETGCAHTAITTGACAPDAGPAAQDAGVDAPDAGSEGRDAGGVVGRDAGTHAGGDAGTSAGSDAGTSSGGGGSTRDSGCSCRTAGGDGSSHGALLAMAALGAAWLVRSRRRARR